MGLRPITAALLLALGVGAAGCGGRLRGESAAVEVPPRIASTSDMLAGLNALALLEADHPDREPLRGRLVAYLGAYVERQLRDGDPDEAIAALHHALSAYTPAELRGSTPAPPLARAGRALYRAAARPGDEDPALLGLATVQQFGAEKDRTWAGGQWRDLSTWMESGNVFARDLELVGGVERRLEEVSAVFPSPWVVAQLDRLYADRFIAARRVETGTGMVDDAQSHRIRYTPYLRARLHLRADDLHAAVAALEDTRDPYMTQLREKIRTAAGEARTAQPILDLMAEMRPSDEDADALPDSVATQAWGIVDNLARRALARHPADPLAHYHRAEYLRRAGLRPAALVHYERVLEREEGPWEVWARVAALYQEQLELTASTDVERAQAMLARVEAFHARAVERWPERPVEPSAVAACAAVARGLYEAGAPDEAKEILDRAVSIEPNPEALDLLGTIALKRSAHDAAWSRYEELLLLPFADQDSRAHWEIRAHTQLGEIAIQSGRPAAGERQLRSALSGLNGVLAEPMLEPPRRVEYLVDRSRVLFFLGETDLAMADFHAAEAIAPDAPRVYAEPLLFAGGHGYYPQALEVYEHAMARPDVDPSLRLYFSLWITDLARRRDVAPPADAVRFVARYEGEPWHRALARHARGELGYDALLRQASDAGERAEAHFYEGLARWRAGDQDGGLSLMRKVLETGMMSFFEYEMAQNYLTWHDLPRTARSPLGTRPRPSER